MSDKKFEREIWLGERMRAGRDGRGGRGRGGEEMARDGGGGCISLPLNY